METLLRCYWECKLVQLLWRTVWRFLKKLKIELPYDPTILLLGIYPEKIIIQKDTCTLIFIATLLTMARTWKQPKCPSAEECIDKEVVYIYIQWNITQPWKEMKLCHLQRPVLCLVAQLCPTLCDHIDCSLPGSSVHGDSPGKYTGVGCHALLHGIFPTQGSNQGLLHCRWILYSLSHQGSPRILKWVAYPFSRGSF